MRFALQNADSIMTECETGRLCKLHFGFSRALYNEIHILKQATAGATQILRNVKIATAKPAPSPSTALIGRLGMDYQFRKRSRVAGMRTGAPTQLLH